MSPKIQIHLKTTGASVPLIWGKTNEISAGNPVKLSYSFLELLPFQSRQSGENSNFNLLSSSFFISLVKGSEKLVAFCCQPFSMHRACVSAYENATV
jgi:hypothetical protein